MMDIIFFMTISLNDAGGATSILESDWQMYIAAIDDGNYIE